MPWQPAGGPDATKTRPAGNWVQDSLEEWDITPGQELADADSGKICIL